MSKMMRVVLFAVCLGCCSCFGAPWFARGNKFKVDTVIVTGNYKTPRLIAELILNESRQPYLIVPSEKDPQQLCFLVVPKGLSIAVTMDKVGNLIYRTGCRRVVILGDERFVPAKFEALLDKRLPKFRATGTEWNLLVNELTDLLNLSNLKRNFPKLVNAANQTYMPVKPVPGAPASEGTAALPAAESAPGEK